MGLTNFTVQEMFKKKKQQKNPNKNPHSKAEHCYGIDLPLSNYIMSLISFFILKVI